jgi:hypothetical protein
VVTLAGCGGGVVSPVPPQPANVTAAAARQNMTDGLFLCFFIASPLLLPKSLVSYQLFAMQVYCHRVFY